MSETTATRHSTQALASFLAGLRYEHLREEIEKKARSLAAFQNGASDEEMARIVGRVWSVDQEHDVRDLLPEA